MDNVSTNKHSSLREIVIEFGRNTTIHSIGKQVRPNVTTARRLLWLSFFLASLSYLIFQFKGLVIHYMSHPITIRNDWQVSRQLPFPAVTVCNLNPMRKSRIATHSFWKDFLNENGTNKGVRSLQEARNKFAIFINTLNETERKLVGHQEKDLIVKCSWKGEDCNKRFKRFFSPSYGNCFIFNPIEKGNILQATSTGDVDSLSLTLNIEGSEYIGALSEYVGAIVELHQPGIMPFPRQEGLKMAPGFSTNIGMTMEKFVRLGDPFTKCRDENQMIHGKLYSVDACLKICAAKACLEKCGCIKPIDDIDPSCDPYNETQRRCVKNAEDTVLEGALKRCDCFPPCRQTVYDYSSSFTAWPSKANWHDWKQDFATRTSLNESVSLETIRENFLNVHIFYKTFNYRTTVEVEAYSFGNLVGDVGGQLGLFVGMSVLSLAEVFELLIDVVSRLMKRSSADIQNTEIKSKDTETKA